jgi:hypothetical protein
LIGCPFSSVSQVAVREVAECGEHAQRLLHRARDQRRVVQQQPALVRVLHQRAHAARVGGLGAVVAGGHQQEEAHHDLVLLQLLAVDLGVDEHAQQVVGGPLAPLRDELAAALEDLRHVALDDGSRAGGVVGPVSGPECRVHQPGPDGVVLLRDAHEAADHARHHGLCHVVDEIAGVAALDRVEHPDGDPADLVLVLGDALGREAGLEQRLQPVVLRRIHADEHRLHQLQREDHAHRRDPVALGRVGAPVAAHRVDVVRRGHRPEAGHVRELGHTLRTVHRAARAQVAEQLERRPVLPVLVIPHAHFVEPAAVHRCHQTASVLRGC